MVGGLSCARRLLTPTRERKRRPPMRKHGAHRPASPARGRWAPHRPVPSPELPPHVQNIRAYLLYTCGAWAACKAGRDTYWSSYIQFLWVFELTRLPDVGPTVMASAIRWVPPTTIRDWFGRPNLPTYLPCWTIYSVGKLTSTVQTSKWTEHHHSRICNIQARGL